MNALLVACGALAREVIAARDRKGWDAKVLALPASLHNTPKDIAPAVERRVAESGDDFEPVIVVYGDCGTRGELARLLSDRGWLSLSGPHCYSTYAGDWESGLEFRNRKGWLLPAAPSPYWLTILVRVALALGSNPLHAVLVVPLQRIRGQYGLSDFVIERIGDGAGHACSDRHGEESAIE